jgi:hypothetical protein
LLKLCINGSIITAVNLNDVVLVGDIFIAVLLKICVFWDVMLCRNLKSLVLDYYTLKINLI